MRRWSCSRWILRCRERESPFAPSHGPSTGASGAARLPRRRDREGRHGCGERAGARRGPWRSQDACGLRARLGCDRGGGRRSCGACEAGARFARAARARNRGSGQAARSQGPCARRRPRSRGACEVRRWRSAAGAVQIVVVRPARWRRAAGPRGPHARAGLGALVRAGPKARLGHGARIAGEPRLRCEWDFSRARSRGARNGRGLQTAGGMRRGRGWRGASRP